MGEIGANVQARVHYIEQLQSLLLKYRELALDNYDYADFIHEYTEERFRANDKVLNELGIVVEVPAKDKTYRTFASGEGV